ncbi:hypothetical protein T4D_6840 [Trichinella pseudospiralis]|nr:hypothetical protein T4D_6840 [Trichinella pseudospiralis]
MAKTFFQILTVLPQTTQWLWYNLPLNFAYSLS